MAATLVLSDDGLGSQFHDLRRGVAKFGEHLVGVLSGSGLGVRTVSGPPVICTAFRTMASGPIAGCWTVPVIPRCLTWGSPKTSSSR
jgi:hypothetical protein